MSFLKPYTLRTIKLKAFTLYEMLVVLILSSLVVTMIYFSFSWLRKEFSIFQKQNKLEQEILLLKTQLKSDLKGVQKVNLKSGILILYSSKDTVKYSPTSTNLLRSKQNSHIHFSISNSRFKLYHESDVKKIPHRFISFVFDNQKELRDSILFLKELDSYHVLY